MHDGMIEKGIPRRTHRPVRTYYCIEESHIELDRGVRDWHVLGRRDQEILVYSPCDLIQVGVIVHLFVIRSRTRGQFTQTQPIDEPGASAGVGDLIFRAWGPLSDATRLLLSQRLHSHSGDWASSEPVHHHHASTGQARSWHRRRRC